MLHAGFMEYYTPSSSKPIKMNNIFIGSGVIFTGIN